MGSNSAHMTLSIKAIALSAVVVPTAVMLHLSGPTIARLASDEIPRVYGSFVSWLTPPYLYFALNGIIISIAASSRFHRSGSDEDAIGSRSEHVRKHQEFVVVAAPTPMVEQEEVKVDLFAVPMAEYKIAKQEVLFGVISGMNWTPMSKETETGKVAEVLTKYSFPTEKEAEKVADIPTEYPVLTEKPPVSARLGRRKSLKASLEVGKVLGVTRPKRNDTLESTWKAIMDGRAVPLTHHLKKSDTTWETHHHQMRSSGDSDPSSHDPTLMRRCETFDDRGARRPTASASQASRLKKEPSLGQDDLNRRVEAFIKKFNEEMRLQGRESHQHYLDMINNGGSCR